MSIPLFFAMTGNEIQKHPALPPKIAWMSCHFSPHGPGLVDLPRRLPPDSMLILDDSIPIKGHDPALVAGTLAQAARELRCAYILLDFQRPGGEEMAESIVRESPRPVGVTLPYARELNCPVFLPPVPPHILIKDYIAPWQGRELWLELALDGSEAVVTGDGCRFTSVPFPVIGQTAHHAQELNCHYTVTTDPERILFSLYRTSDDLSALVHEADALDITLAVGLYQELTITK